MKKSTKRLLALIIAILIIIFILAIRSPIMFGASGIVTKCNNFGLYDISKAKVHDYNKEKNLYILNFNFHIIYVYSGGADNNIPQLVKSKKLLPFIWKIPNKGNTYYTIVSGENKYYYVYLSN